jgi:preprotein translocase subunit Sec63
MERKAANMAGVLSMKDVIKVLLDDRITPSIPCHVAVQLLHLQIEPKAANMAGVLSMKDVIMVLLDDRITLSIACHVAV